MDPVLVVIIAAVVLLVAAGWWWSRRNRHADGVDSFRRQIDALSSEARRSTVEQLHHDPAKSEPGTDELDDDGSHG